MNNTDHSFYRLAIIIPFFNEEKRISIEPFIRKKVANFRVEEISLNKWEHRPGLKINVFSLFRVIKEIYTLFTKY